MEKSLACPKCRNTLIAHSLLCFYAQGNGVHCVVKPEFSKPEFLQNILIKANDDPKRRQFTPNKLYCKKCGVDIGNECAIGPNKEKLFSFGSQDFFGKKKMWQELAKSGSWRLEKRNEKTIMGALPETEAIPPKARDFTATVAPRIDEHEASKIVSTAHLLSKTNARKYQVELVLVALMRNTIAVIPTGAGKTHVAHLVISKMKEWNPKKLAVFLVTRIPLVGQQQAYFQKECNSIKLQILGLSGEDSTPQVRRTVLEKDVFVTTGGLFLSMLAQDEISLRDCCLLVFDEAHNATGKSQYSQIMQRFYFECPAHLRPKILGLTASPATGDAAATVEKSLSTLSEVLCAEVYSPQAFSQQLEEFTNQTTTEWCTFSLPESEENVMRNIKHHVRDIMNQEGLPQIYYPFLWKDIRCLQANTDINKIREKKNEILYEHLRLVLQTCALFDVFGHYRTKYELERKTRVLSGKSCEYAKQLKAIFAHSSGAEEFSSRTQHLIKNIDRIMSNRETNDSRVLIFADTRDTTKVLTEVLGSIGRFKPLNPMRIIGNSGFDGMTWAEEQSKRIKYFNAGISRILVATSVVEEGLDVRSCNAVIRYNGINNLKSLVQSRGRARHMESRFIVMCLCEEHEKMKRILAQESLAKIVIRAAQRPITAFNMQSIINEHYSSNASTTSKNTPAPVSIQPSIDLVLQIYPKTSHTNKRKIDEALAQVANVADFEPEQGLLRLQAKGMGRNRNPVAHFLREICPCWKLDPPCWVAVLQPIMPCAKSCGVPDISEISCGYFMDPGCFIETKSDLFPDALGGTLYATEKGLHCDFQYPNSCYKLVFNFTAMERLVVLSLAENSLYVTVKSSPYAFIEDLDGRTFRDVPIFLGHEAVYKIVLSSELNSEWIFFLNTMFLKQSIKLCFGSLRTVIDTPVSISEHSSFNVWYEFSLFLSQYGSTWLGVVNHLLDTSEDKNEEDILNTLRYLRQTSKFDLQATSIDTLIRTIDLAFHLPCPLPCTFASFVLLKKISITPSRFIFGEPVAVAKNRVLRQFKESDAFILVDFIDEEGQRVSGGDGSVSGRIRRILEGGLKLQNRLYHFIFGNARKGSCWFSLYTVGELKLGDFSAIKNPGKILARRALAFASSIPTVGLQRPITRQVVVPDIEVKFEGKTQCFSDGCGAIGPDLMAKICSFLKLPTLVSAIQVRVGGIKGVYSLNPNLIGEQMITRKKMFKFASDHCQIEVLGYTRYIPCHLNRQIITLLSSLGIKDEVFEKLQQQQLERMLEALKDPVKCMATLTQILAHTGIHPSALQKAGVDVLFDDFFRRLLWNNYHKKLQLLRKKSRIFVENGRLLMGVLDEIGVLEPNQVYISCSPRSEDEETLYVEGDVIVTKNPCLHPGDIRKLTAVGRVAELAHLVDCIVFPRPLHPGSVFRSIPNQISGSDLDGDLYHVIWEKTLIPHSTVEPATYPDTEEMELDVVKDSDLVTFYLDYREDNIGKIANAHLAHADNKGAQSSICKKLAEMHAIEVDFPKTGKHVELFSSLMPAEYPSFMEVGGPSYESEKVIGKLHTSVATLNMPQVPDLVVVMDCEMVVEGFEEFSEKAEEFYEEYSQDILGIMRLFGIKSEAEVVSGQLLDTHNHIKVSQHKVSKTVKHYYAELQADYRKRFDEWTKSVTPTFEEHVIQQCASAWYQIPYTPQDQSQEDDTLPNINSRHLLSFAWIVWDVLCRIKKEKWNKVPVSYSGKFTQSIRSALQKSKVEMLPEFLERETIRDDLEMCIRPTFPEAQVYLFGSSSFMLFETSSDVDICFQAPKNVQDPLAKVFPTLVEMYPGIERISGRTTFPIVRYTGGQLSFDLSADTTAYQNTLLLKNYLFAYPFLLPLLQVVVKWGRAHNIIEHGVGAKMKLFGLVWLFVNYCLEHEIIRPVHQHKQVVTHNDHEDSMIFWQDIFERGEEDVANHGDTLMGFFHTFACIDTTKDFKLLNPIQSTVQYRVNISPLELRFLSNQALNAVHTLVLFADVKALFIESGTTKRLMKKLPKSIASRFAGAEEWNSQRLSNMFGVEVKIKFRGGSEPTNLNLEAVGNRYKINELEAYLTRIGKSLVVVRNTFGVFVEGATLLLFEGSLRSSDEIGFYPYTGRYHQQHEGREKHTPNLIQQVVGDSWEDFAFHRFQSTTVRQLGYASQCTHAEMGKLNAAIRFGTAYVVNANTRSPSLHTIEDLEQAIVAGRRMKKPWLSRLSSERDVWEFDDKEKGKKVGPSRSSPYDCEKEPKEFKKHKCSKSLFTEINLPIGKVEEILLQGGYTFEREYEYYTASVLANSVHELKINFDQNLKMKSVYHRATRWLAATLITQKNPTDPYMTPDCTFYLNSEMPVSEKILEKVERGGSVFTAIENDMLRLNPNFDKRITLVRYHKVKVFAKTVPKIGKISAELGQIRATSDLDLGGISHIELDLHFSPAFQKSFIQAWWQEGLDVWRRLKDHTSGLL